MPFYEIVAPFIWTFPPDEVKLARIIEDGFVVGVHEKLTALLQLGF